MVNTHTKFKSYDTIMNGLLITKLVNIRYHISSIFRSTYRHAFLRNNNHGNINLKCILNGLIYLTVILFKHYYLCQVSDINPCPCPVRKIRYPCSYCEKGMIATSKALECDICKYDLIKLQ